LAGELVLKKSTPGQQKQHQQPQQPQQQTVVVNAVQAKKPKRCTVTMDSGAGASCLPKDWLPGAPLKPRKKGVKFLAAEGSDMGYYGRKDVRFKAVRSEGGKVVRGTPAQMEFHVTNSNKALASAVDITDAGNNIILSKKKGESVIINDRTQEKIHLRRENGTFVFDIELEGEFEDDAKMEVDEGAKACRKPKLTSPFARRE
jgi:hypothetical protein